MSHISSSSPQPIRLGCVAELAAACLVSKAWLGAARGDLPWRSVYVRQYGEPHTWEACRSFREQCTRRVGLRWPRHAPPLPGPPAPGTQLEAYDKMYGVRTLAVSYDPASRALLRAVRSRALVGDDARVAVQSIPLEPAEGAEPGAGPGVSGGDVAAAATAEPAPPSPARGPAGGITGATTPDCSSDGAQWVCMLSVDGRMPPSPPPPDVQDDDDGEAGGPAGGGGGDGGEHLAEAGVRQIAALAELLPTVMCCAAGLLYLPAGPTGRGLAVWDLTATRGHAAPAAAAAAAAAPDPAAAGGAAAAAPEPYWLVPEAHRGRLLAAATDGCLAVSGCDGGVLRFWQGRRRAALGQADIGDLTRLPVLDAFPRAASHAGAGRHRLRIAVCEASGLAVVALASPLAPKIYIYRATPRGGGGGGGGGGDGDASGGGGGGGVGQLLASPSVHAAPCSGLLLFRRRMLTIQVMCSDVMGARFGGSGGSSVLVTLVICMWQLPEGEEEQEEEQEEEGGGGGSEAARGASREEVEGEEGAGHWSDSWTRLYSSRLQLEHPRTLVLGRMRPLLAASEDLMLMTVPRNVGGRPPHSQLLALELPPRRRTTRGSVDGGGSSEEGADEEEEKEEGDGAAAEAAEAGAGGAPRRRRLPPPRQGGIVGGGGRMMVVPEAERLQWVEVIEDAGDVVAAVVPTPRHLALLSEDGRLRLYGIVSTDEAVPADPPS
ncbi:hypothetical protein PLESTM_000447600 [Pleodorina starrii]|nr:hypothetical protein PLESTM_000447600 [Pleodorina starrii]